MDEKRMKAEIRRLRKLLKAQEREIEVADRIVAVVRDSIEVVPTIQVPGLPTFDEGQRDEVALLLLSDLHIGKKTATYNPRVFVKRLRKLETSMMSIIAALRSVRPLRKLVIVFNGDKKLSPNSANSVKLPTLL